MRNQFLFDKYPIPDLKYPILESESISIPNPNCNHVVVFSVKVTNLLPGYPTSHSAYDGGQAMYPMQPPAQPGVVYMPSDQRRSNGAGNA